MDGYRFMIERNRLLHKLEAQLEEVRNLPELERRSKTSKLQAAFDRELAELYAQVLPEFPGERRKQARAISDPR